VTVAAGELTGETADRADVFEAPALLRILWADPQNMPEHLAVWSLARFGPRAERSLGKLRASHPDASREQLEAAVVRRQTDVAMTEGAFVGGPFVVLIPIAFCAALLAQAQMVYELAGVAGEEPTDRTRAVDLLRILGVYGSAEEAAAALARLPRDPGQREGKKLPRGTRWDMIRRMAYLLGVLGTDDGRSRLRGALGWCGIGVLFLVGLVLPLVWVPYMAYSVRRSALRMGRRARAFYAGEGTAAVAVQHGEHVRIGGTAAFARMTVLVVLPIVAALVALATGFSLGGGRRLGALLLLLVVSAAVTLAWLGYRWWRHRRRAIVTS
jgi:hypothetical protein